MKRIITYLFTYDSGNKGKNVGFVKTDLRGTECSMEVHINGYTGYQGKVKWYLLIADGDGQTLTGIALGEFVLSHGRGSARRKFAIRPIEGTDYDFSQVVGVGIRCGSSGYLASCWKEAHCQAIGKGEFSIWNDREAAGETPAGKDMRKGQDIGELKGMQPNPGGRAEMEQPSMQSGSPGQRTIKSAADETEKRKSNTQEAEKQKLSTPAPGLQGTRNREPEKPESENPEQKKAETKSTDPASAEAKGIGASPTAIDDTGKKSVGQQCLMQEQESIRRIDLSDIKKLPSRNWYLCSNSFLLHGFFNYHYLIIKKVSRDGKEKYYLGVPGIYEKPERVMATLFGFPEFERAEGAPGFGYWLCLLDM